MAEKPATGISTRLASEDSYMINNGLKHECIPLERIT